MVYTKIERLEFNPVKEHKAIMAAIESPGWSQVSVGPDKIIFERVEVKTYSIKKEEDKRKEAEDDN